MHVAVIGAGIIGVTTAYCLRRRGVEVTVLERHSGVAQEASFANGGVVAPGYTGPWSAPGTPAALLAALFRRDAALRMPLSADPALWRWLRRFVAESTLDRYRANRRRMYRLAAYSREQLHALHARHAIDYERQPGLLQLFRSEREIDRHEPVRALLTELGATHRLLTADACRAIECALNEQTALAGGLHLPDDETGNCAYFARRLKEIGESDGVRYEFGCTVNAIELTGGRATAVATAQGLRRVDAVVLAAGADAAGLLAGSGLRVPLQPAVGYSATVPITRHELAPLVSVLDERFKVAVTRMGKRLRIAGLARIGQRRPAIDAATADTLLGVARDWYPGAAAYSRAQLWAGVRPMLPDGPPALGRTGIGGLFVNIGHGASGWAMACGAAQVVADVVTGHAPEIDLDGLTFDRFATPSGARGQPALNPQ
ncbi:MAG: D-amino acid dehydrogenase [Burkholderiaceae bacterium]|jgi:D-amino-acid dehydrogenase|nr:D-amino acid dehydrogenase [Burkholderiaceae bacterium]